ncbi:MAG: flagellar protein FlgN [Chitinispirillales bacterium]|jgi:hypothetical protein|nr:flagellar protein FlgN [Chitinispirillales bacterium]
MVAEKTLLFNELAGLLEQENDIHQNLINAAQEINNCAKGKDIEGLQKRSAIFDEHICGLEKAEERRHDICERLKDMLGNIVPSGRMITLIEQSEPDVRSRLRELRKSLMERVAQLKALNTSNIVLFREALGGITASIDIIKTSATPKTNYRHRGDFKPHNCNLSLFNQVV